MSEEDKLGEFIRQYQADRESDLRQTSKDRHENLGYILFSFAVATLSLATAQINLVSTIINIFATLGFFVLGAREMGRARRQK